MFTEDEKAANLLDWPHVNRRLTWGVYFMSGGGSALGEACKVHNIITVI